MPRLRRELSARRIAHGLRGLRRPPRHRLRSSRLRANRRRLAGPLRPAARRFALGGDAALRDERRLAVPRARSPGSSGERHREQARGRDAALRGRRSRRRALVFASLRQARGREPDALLQGPRHDRRRLVGAYLGILDRRVRFDRRHVRGARGLRRGRARHARGRSPAGREDHGRAAQPGARVRGDDARPRNGLRRLHAPRRRADRRPSRLSPELEKPGAHRGTEDDRVGDRPGSRLARAGLDRRAGRERGQRVGDRQGAEGVARPRRHREEAAPRGSPGRGRGSLLPVLPERVSGSASRASPARRRPRRSASARPCRIRGPSARSGSSTASWRA